MRLVLAGSGKQPPRQSTPAHSAAPTRRQGGTLHHASSRIAGGGVRDAFFPACFRALRAPAGRARRATISMWWKQGPSVPPRTARRWPATKGRAPLASWHSCTTARAPPPSRVRQQRAAAAPHAALRAVRHAMLCAGRAQDGGMRCVRHAAHFRAAGATPPALHVWATPPLALPPHSPQRRHAVGAGSRHVPGAGGGLHGAARAAPRRQPARHPHPAAPLPSAWGRALLALPCCPAALWLQQRGGAGPQRASMQQPFLSCSGASELACLCACMSWFCCILLPAGAAGSHGRLPGAGELRGKCVCGRAEGQLQQHRQPCSHRAVLRCRLLSVRG